MFSGILTLSNCSTYGFGFHQLGLLLTVSTTQMQNGMNFALLM